jgi:hypothetical protein
MLLIIAQGGKSGAFSLSLSSSLASTFSEIFVAQQICRNLGLKVLSFLLHGFFKICANHQSAILSFFLSSAVDYGS